MPLASSWTPWLLLTIAILFEVAGTASMKLSRGFAELLPSIAVFVFYFAAVAALVLALKRLELSIAYAVWSALGTAITPSSASPISASRSPPSSSARSLSSSSG